MDSKRPDVRLDDKPDEDGVVTRRDGSGDRRTDDHDADRSLVSRIRSLLKP
ncbi:hypothetical protein [Natronobacterium texcoconense]|uniref:Uncharacterized protein n=1 Tax=Natronobacterium texcoconense TaxID=1095778 RepID=A0A1H1FAS0_NATTX|nr:hypothetical protein [Natronobacterium texcoconense]SDQ97938.1 hypothetical protein SAMN04489842_1889 [Natronobacterium texcoconense]